MRFSLEAGSSPVRIARAEKLHIGCGRSAIAGWTNVDQFALPGVDRVLNVGEGLPFEDVSFLYAEHFLEHLPLQEGLAFLRACRRVLSPGGVIRVSTPNLDWVMLTHYRPEGWSTDARAIEDCLNTNRAFRGWGHQFLYNRQTLGLALTTAGFRDVSFHRYGESDRPELCGLEQHETYEDVDRLPHVVIAQATGWRPPEKSPEPFLLYHREVTLR